VLFLAGCARPDDGNGISRRDAEKARLRLLCASAAQRESEPVHRLPEIPPGRSTL